jgi:hypothetical protein
MKIMRNCNKCCALVKRCVGDEKWKFNACCGKTLVEFYECKLPRIIKENVGEMQEIKTPDWCPLIEDENKPIICLPPSTNKPKVTKTYLTYTEKKDEMSKFPRRLKWEDINEDEIYVIPKILSQTRKVVRIIIKNDNFLKCSEIDEYGNESKTLTSIYPKDIDAIFITKFLKF